MTYGAFLIRHPLFWSSLSGAALGIALASATRDTRRDRRPARSRSRKLTSAALWATTGVIAATCGILVPEGTEFIGLPSLFVGIGSVALFALALRFPRSCGIPTIFVLAATAILGPLVMRPYVPVRDVGVVATVTLLATDNSGAYLEVGDHTPPTSRMPAVIELASPTVVAQVHTLEISDYLFFLGATTGVSLRGFRTEEVAGATGNPATVTMRSVSDLFAETPLIETVINWLPLLERGALASQPVSLDLLVPYEVVGFPAAEVRIRVAGGSE